VRRQAVRVLRLSVGGVLLLVGVIGLFVPILQGWLFIFAGLSVMAPESPTAHRALDWTKSRFRRHGRRKADVNECHPAPAGNGGASGEPLVSRPLASSGGTACEPRRSQASDPRGANDER
jgi:hypothetical protein